MSLLTLLLVAVSRPAVALPNHASYDDIIARGVISVAVYENFAPFSYRRDGKLVGVDVDLATAIAAKLGVKAEFRELQADETVADDLRNAIWKGHYLGGGIVDLMMHVPDDTQFARRNDMVVIFGSYYEESFTLVRDREVLGGTVTLANFRYDKVGVELDSLPDFYLLGTMGGALRENVIHYPTVAEAMAGLKRQEVAAVFATRSQIEAGLDGNPRYDITAILAPGMSKPSWPLGVAVSKYTRQLGYVIEDIIAELLADGTVAKIFADHGISHLPPHQN